MGAEDLITKLNGQIAMMDPNIIKMHYADKNLDKWLKGWKMETAAVSFGLAYQIAELKINLTWEELKEIVLNIPTHGEESTLLKGLILENCIKKMEEKKNELIK